MIDRDQFAAFRGRFFTGEHSIASPDCLDIDTIAALADGALDSEARATALRHVSRCTICREAVASVANALADDAVTHEIDKVEGRRRGVRWGGRVALSLAAAAILVLLLRAPSDDTPPHRAPSPPAVGAVPLPQTPLGVVAAVDRFHWTRVDGADLYRVTLFDATGRILFTATVRDTALGFPDSVSLVPAHAYLWKVDAGVGFDRWTSSELVEFSISPKLRR